MEPSKVRERILTEHSGLRSDIEALEKAMGELEKHLGTVAALTRALLVRLTAHIRDENAVLVPALRRADIWGPDRAEQILPHHRQQTAELSALLTKLESPTLAPKDLASIARLIITDLRRDMIFEEAHYLREDILRDDVVTINAECG